MRCAFTCSAIVATLVVAPVVGQSQTTSQTPAPAGAASSQAQMAGDEQFAKELALGNMTEIEAGKTAEKNAASADVRSFGQRLVQDHGKALAELRTIAQTKSINLPTTLDAEHRGKVEKLSPLTGAAFDRAFVDDMVMAHRQTVTKLKTEISNGKDAELKAFATKVLPTVEEHLKIAEGLQRKVVGTAGNK